MKGGPRRQFQKILSDPLVTYLGHVTVAEHGDLTIPDLKALGFDALVFAIGAQGTKYLGIEGERLPGVYHAKDLVYHYNHLPPFSEQPYPIGKRIAIVGVGNVMVDIANYCAHFCGADEVIAVARRGPFEKAYDDREFEDVEDAFDRDLYRQEIARIRPRLEAARPDPAERPLRREELARRRPRLDPAGRAPDELLRALGQRPEPETSTRARLSFRFLA